MMAHSWRDWAFSGKAFLAGMLALYIAMALDLSRPYWALSAVYIVSSPFSGATKSKALYRILGTLLGAGAAVFFVPLFVNAPELLSLVVALWTGTLLLISMLDRTARSYVFMLAGYTLPLIALPSLDAPDTVFATALARSEEIALGIICASVVNSVIFPASLNAQFGSRIQGWLSDAGSWADEILRGEGASPTTPVKRQQLATDVAGLDLLISQLSYDLEARDVVHHARELRGRLLMLLPVFSSVADRLHAVRQGCDRLPESLTGLLSDVADWFKTGGPSDAAQRAQVLLDRMAQQQAAHQLHGWNDLVFSGLLMRLKVAVELWRDCLLLQDRIANGRHTTVDTLSDRHFSVASRHFDHAFLALKAGIVVVGIVVACAIWIGLEWSQGAGFVAMVAVACSFFAAQDRPAPMIRFMLVWTTVSVFASFVYLFGILPFATNFEMMALALAPFLLLLGLKMTNPQTAVIGMLVAVNVATLVGIQDRYTADFESFANGGVATVLGIAFAYVWISVAHPFGARLAAKRLLRSGWRDLADTAAGLRSADSERLAGRILDRLGQLVPRLAALNERELVNVDGFADVRLAINVVTLQEERRRLSVESAASVSQVLVAVADHYRRQLRAGRAQDSDATLMVLIDNGLQTVVHKEGDEARRVIDALVGLRRVFFPQASAPDLQASPQPLPQPQTPSIAAE
ncbi:FUSC family protein [Allorhizobium terrae]|uniref:FUSC family protein n=1 Tax=Allorhizobium terrae TaxID=1848972 RepID=A0A4V3W7R6_9HYPH|nr:FUSC family protein [Allorhizobium terrae]THF48330.1 FUSC family protein [Allorhizobium terrae]